MKNTFSSNEITKSPVINIVLQRMRAPLIVLIVSYTISVIGLTLIPGVDDQGNEWHFSYFHAFYFFSYVATTIGFGELPFSFTDEQRLWVTFCIYLTVISWLVAIGKLISLFQDEGFKFALNKAKFIRNVRHLNQPFCILCGYGQSGESLLKELHDCGYSCVVLENASDRLSVLDLKNSLYASPSLNADASDPNNLEMAGIYSPFCKAIITLTNNDDINVKVALSAKLLRPDVKVICKAYSKESIANAESFDTDHVINPFKVFAEKFVMGFRTPNLVRFIETVLSPSGMDFPKEKDIPSGKWILCGYTRFGKEVERYLEYEGIDVTVVDVDISVTKSGFIKGRATEAIALRKAGIESAAGLIASYPDDAMNLSIIMTARRENPNLYLVSRQNVDSNVHVFDAANIDVVVKRSAISVKNILPLVTQPSLAHLVKHLRHMDDDFGKEMMNTFLSSFDKTPEIYPLYINESKAKPVYDAIRADRMVRLQDLMTDPRNNSEKLFPAEPLLLIRDGKYSPLPRKSITLQVNDEIIMASTSRVAKEIKYTMKTESELHYILEGKELSVSIAFKYFKNRVIKYKMYINKILASVK